LRTGIADGGFDIRPPGTAASLFVTRPEKI